jgi:hypothetical protein
MWRPLLVWSWRWFFRSWRRNLQRVSTTAAVMTMARQLVNGKPEVVFRGSLHLGAGIQVRVLEPGER